MCGIIGLVVKAPNGFTQKTEAIAKQLLFADTLRGEDSTGIITVENNGSFTTAKEAVAGPLFLNKVETTTEIFKALWGSGKAFIGHNRKATIGKVVDETAHPFVINDTFAMVHNGTLHNHQALAPTEVDSEALAIVLEKALLDNTLEDTLKNVWGAYAIAAYSQTKEKVYLLRNKERPLFIAKTDVGVMWASEYAMLMWVLGRNGIEIKAETINTVPEDTLVTIDLTTCCVEETKLNLQKMSVTPVKPQEKRGRQIDTTKKHSFISKNEYKRIKKQCLGTKIWFFPDDFIEINGAATMFIGEGLDYDFEHSVKGSIPMEQLKAMRLKPEGIIDGYPLYGTVYEVEYHHSGTINFYIKDVTIYGDEYETHIKGLKGGTKESEPETARC